MRAVVLALTVMAIAACRSGEQPGASPTSTPTPQPTIDLSTVVDAYKPEFDSSPAIPGVYVPPNPGIDGRLLTRDDILHLDPGVHYPLCSAENISANRIAGCYNSNPPTSGPHAAAPAAFKVFDFAVPKENLVHNMEHGGVVIWYGPTTNAAAVSTLTRLALDAEAAGRLVVMSPYPDLEPDPIALTSWTRLDKFKSSELTEKRVTDFIGGNERRFNPEGF
ncbi:MAG TPA: DUF3105 domain-containing protein [Dehalococcoidia bacterium]